MRGRGEKVNKVLLGKPRLFILQMIYSMEPRCKRKTEELREKLSQCHFVHHRSHID
jgi:hypothetical protein